MKKNLLVAALLVSASFAAFGQGTIVFNNRQTTAGTGAAAPVVAPIFGMDPANPTLRKTGNPTATWNGSNGPTPAPLGTQTYAGVPLRGTGFTAQLWGANSVKADTELLLVASTTFRTATTASLQGFINPLAGGVNPPVSDTPSSATERAKFQIRVWDNVGGTIQTWTDALTAWQEGRIQAGWSDIFLVDFQLGQGTGLAPNLVGLQSFNLTQIPEPSVIALGVLGAGCLFLLRRRK